MGLAEFDENKPMPCIIVFDSLSAHNPNHVAKKVNEWLWIRWKKKHGDAKEEDKGLGKMFLREPKGKW